MMMENDLQKVIAQIWEISELTLQMSSTEISSVRVSSHKSGQGGKALCDLAVPYSLILEVYGAVYRARLRTAALSSTLRILRHPYIMRVAKSKWPERWRLTSGISITIQQLRLEGRRTENEDMTNARYSWVQRPSSGNCLPWWKSVAVSRYPSASSSVRHPKWKNGDRNHRRESERVF